MSTNEFIGAFVIALGAFIPVVLYFAKGAWNLSKAITELQKTIEFIELAFVDNKKKMEVHDDILSDHETRISIIEEYKK